MKNLSRTLIPALPILLALPLNALATDPPKTGLQASEIIEEQFNVTHGFVQAAVKDVGHEGRDDKTPPPQDYLDQAKLFNERLAQVLQQFETEVSANVVTPLAPAVAKFNQLMSMSMSQGQSQQMHDQNIKELEEQAKPYIPVYQAAIEKVYHFLDLPFDPKLDDSEIVKAEECPETLDAVVDGEKKDKATGAYRLRNKEAPEMRRFTFSVQTPHSQSTVTYTGCEMKYAMRFLLAPGPLYTFQVAFPSSDFDFMTETRYTYDAGQRFLHQLLPDNSYGVAAASTQDQDMQVQAFQTLIFPAVSEGCQTLPCVALRAADLEQTLRKIKTNIDHALAIPLVNQFRNSYMVTSNADYLWIPAANRDISNLATAVKRLDYPKDFVARATRP